jgi:hypothetical protein
MAGKAHGELSYTGCTVTVKTVKIARLYLNRLRVWDSTGKPLAAMRIWSETPFAPGMLMNMQPTVAPGSHITIAEALAGVEEAIVAEEVFDAAQA